MTESTNPWPSTEDNGPSTADARSRLAALMDDQRSQWRGGTPIEVEAYLHDHSFLRGDPEAILDLIYGEIVLRVDRGESPELDEYVRRFPDLAGPLADQFEVHRALEARRSETSEAPASGIETDLFLPGSPRARRPDHADRSARKWAGRYELLGEIARGGMGAILRGRDGFLGRELAVKVLLEEHRNHPQMIRRFFEEARIGGQLQHPGIVPVYDLGTFDDRRPFFAMKLIGGKTLANLLAARGGPSEEWPRFLSTFESICQTMAYAHSGGVIHRDLKPSNVMVGSFGEVQVLDWGLAKVLGGADPEGVGSEPFEVDSSVEGVSRTPTQPGTRVGTPQYMAPEQARGAVETIDQRSDVFGLGAILCEILTGKPPFVASTSAGALFKAMNAELDDAHSRIESSGADGELIKLAIDCLAAEPESRPADAGAVSDRLTRHLAGVQERLRAAELEKAEAQARAFEAQARALAERRRRRAEVGLAASALALFLIAGGGWLAWDNSTRAARDRATVEVRQAFDDASRAEGEARSRSTYEAWSVAVEAARRAEGLARSGGLSELTHTASALRSRLIEQLAHAETQAKAEARDRAMEKALNKGREEGLASSMKRKEGYNHVRDVYRAAFRSYGVDVEELPVAEATARLRSSALREALAAALDHWTALENAAGPPKLRELANAIDPDPFRMEVRNAMGRNDLDKLRALARRGDAGTLPPITIKGLGKALAFFGQHEEAANLLRRGQALYPGDVFLNFDLAVDLENCQPRRTEEAIRFLTAALALRPENSDAHNSLGIALYEAGRPTEAEAEYSRALAIEPANTNALYNLGVLLLRLERPREALPRLQSVVDLLPDDPEPRDNLGNALFETGKTQEAIVEYDRVLARSPDFAPTHSNRGVALLKLRRTEEATAEFRRAVELDPGFLRARSNLGKVLSDLGRLDEAEAELHRALQIDANYVPAHTNLGLVYTKLGHKVEAESEYRRVCELEPGSAVHHRNLGSALHDLERYEDAIIELKKSLAIEPEAARTHAILGLVYAGMKRPDDAIASYQRAIQLDPNDTEPSYNLALQFSRLNRFDDAIAELGRTLERRPNYAEAHCNLAAALTAKGRFAEAVKEYERGHELGSARPDWEYPSARWLENARLFLSLENRIPAVIRGDDVPKDSNDWLRLADTAAKTGRLAASAQFYQGLLETNPKAAGNLKAGHRYNAACIAARASSEPSKDDPPPDEAVRALWRGHAREWLSADLAAWNQVLENGPAAARSAMIPMLAHWIEDPDLAGVRDEAALAKLPEPECREWHALWTEVNALLKRAQEKTP